MKEKRSMLRYVSDEAARHASAQHQGAPNEKNAVRQNGVIRNGWATRIHGRASRALAPQAKAFGRIPKNCPLGNFFKRNSTSSVRILVAQRQRCRRQFKLIRFSLLKMAGPPGFEPGLRAPKTPVLPLHHGPVRKRRAEPVLKKSVVGREGIEPAALGLKVPCSTS